MTSVPISRPPAAPGVADGDRVELPASLSRRAALGALPLLMLVPGTAAVLALEARVNWVSVALGFLTAACALAWVWGVRRRPALVLDRVGVRNGRGALLLAWTDAATVWVGDAMPAWVPAGLQSPSLWVWDASTVAHMERTGFVAQARLIRPVIFTSVPVADTAAAVSRFSPVPVQTGSASDLGRLLSRLREPPRD